MKKRILSLALAIVMVLGMMPVSASAAGEPISIKIDGTPVALTSVENQKCLSENTNVASYSVVIPEGAESMYIECDEGSMNIRPDYSNDDICGGNTKYTVDLTQGYRVLCIYNYAHGTSCHLYLLNEGEKVNPAPVEVIADGEKVQLTKNDEIFCNNGWLENALVVSGKTSASEVTLNLLGEAAKADVYVCDASDEWLSNVEVNDGTAVISLPLDGDHLCIQMWELNEAQCFHLKLEKTAAAACTHTTTNTTYAQVEGTETHTVTVTCAKASCGNQISQTTENCVDADKNLKCDVCEGTVACKHEGTETTVHYERVEGTETHNATTFCSCGHQIGEAVTADCADENGNGICDLCDGTVEPEIPAAPAEGPWDGTTLTEPAQVDGVYQIGTGAELAWFAQTADPASKAVLTGDIDLNNQTWTAMAKLSGSFDGQGYTIQGLNGSQGLFSTVYGASNTARAEVKNITVEGIVSGVMKVAGIAGSSYWANYTNVINKVNVTGTNQYVGGIVGYSLQGTNGSYITLTNCGNEGTITGSANNVAGLVAYGKGNMVLVGCYNTGAITGSCSGYTSGGVGGLVGYTQGYKDASSLTNCYNTGSVNGKSGYAGGIVGTMYNGVTATNCYNTGTVTGGSGKVGAITGYAYNASNSKAVNCYYLDTSCAAAANGKPAAVNAGTAVKTDAEMKSVEFIALLGDGYQKGETYPALIWEEVDIQINSYKVTAPEGEGFTFAGAAEATNTELYKFSVSINAYYEATDAFAVKVNGEKQEAASVDGHTYNFEYTASSDMVITVEGITYTGVKLSQAAAEMYPADTLTLTAEVDPNAEGTVVWTSDNEAVATVADGVVTALKAGEANITASIGDVSAICKVTVSHKPTVVNTNDGAWGSGQTKINSVTLYDVTVQEHYWKGDTCIVVLDKETPLDAAVRFDKSGNANLLINGTLLNSAQNTASLQDGYAKLTLTAEATGVNVSRTMIIWVDGTYEYVPVTGIEIPAGDYEDGNYRVQANSAITLHAKVLPENATIQDVEWSTTAASTALTVNKAGYVQGSTMGHGSYYTLTVASVEDPTIKTTCQVYLDWKPEDSITISKNTMTLQVGETGTLSASVSGADFVTNTTVTWTSSDDTVAAVSGGKVTGLKNGTATVTATSYYGLTATCEVTVEGGTDECDHVNTETTTLYAQAAGEEKHTATVFCSCGHQIGEVTTEDCVDENKDGKCDRCGGEVKRAITKLTWWISGEKATEITVHVDDVVDATTGCTPRAAYVVTYTSADPDIVTVNTPEATADAEYGHANTSFTAKKVGETTVTAAAKDDPSVTSELKVTVTCLHYKTATTHVPVEGTKTHTATVTCTHEGCQQQLSQVTENCSDGNQDGKCDTCGGEMESAAPQLGDVSGDGVITGYDAALIMQYVAKLTEDLELALADVSGEGQVTGYDAALIMQYVAELIQQFPGESGGN